MQTVSIKIECTLKAAEIIFNTLKQARLIAHSEDKQWICMYVDGQSNFRIGDISVSPENNTELSIDGLLEQNISWQAKATFIYNLNGNEYEHVESNVSMIDNSGTELGNNV